jgi:hypothetical protein
VRCRAGAELLDYHDERERQEAVVSRPEEASYMHNNMHIIILSPPGPY